MTQKKNNPQFQAFNKKFSREQAEWLVYSDYRTRLCEIGDTEVLESMFHFGVKKLSNWTDTELQKLLQEISDQGIENVNYYGEKLEGIDMPQLAVSPTCSDCGSPIEQNVPVKSQSKA